MTLVSLLTTNFVFAFIELKFEKINLKGLSIPIAYTKTIQNVNTLEINMKEVLKSIDVSNQPINTTQHYIIHYRRFEIGIATNTIPTRPDYLNYYKSIMDSSITLEPPEKSDLVKIIWLKAKGIFGATLNISVGLRNWEVKMKDGHTIAFMFKKYDRPINIRVKDQVLVGEAIIPDYRAVTEKVQMTVNEKDFNGNVLSYSTGFINFYGIWIYE